MRAVKQCSTEKRSPVTIVRHTLSIENCLHHRKHCQMKCLAGPSAQAPCASTSQFSNQRQGGPSHLVHRHRLILMHQTQTDSQHRRQCLQHGARRRSICTAAAATAAADPVQAADEAAAELQQWLQQKGASFSTSQLQTQGSMAQPRTGLAAIRSISRDQSIFTVSGDACVTSADVEAEQSIAAAARGRGELTGLALWLLAERRKDAFKVVLCTAQGATSAWAPFLDTLPQRVDTPLVWDDEQRETLLRGSPVAAASAKRAASICKEWGAISAADPGLPPDAFSEQLFLDAMTVVLAHAIYLPAAQCFALVPGLHGLRRSGDPSAATVDYDAASGSVVLTAASSLSEGDEVLMYDGRPNGELMMATGSVQPKNPADYLTIETSLVAADRLWQSKREILDSVGFDSPQEFPISADGMPQQLLSYLRLARLQNSAEFAKVSFDEDLIISPANEYEVLQLLLAECRDRFSAYGDNMEADMKMLQQQDLTPAERMAAQLRMEEKRIVSGTMDAVRARLAPIRGIPTKQGNLQDPNSDLKEIFDTLEGLPSLPGKLVGGIASWARGEQDPDWKKKGKKAPDSNRPW